MNCGATEYIVTFISIYFIGMFLLPLVKGIQEKYHHKIIILMLEINTMFVKNSIPIYNKFDY